MDKIYYKKYLKYKQKYLKIGGAVSKNIILGFGGKTIATFQDEQVKTYKDLVDIIDPKLNLTGDFKVVQETNIIYDSISQTDLSTQLNLDNNITELNVIMTNSKEKNESIIIWFQDMINNPETSKNHPKDDSINDSQIIINLINIILAQHKSFYYLFLNLYNFINKKRKNAYMYIQLINKLYPMIINLITDEVNKKSFENLLLIFPTNDEDKKIFYDLMKSYKIDLDSL
jgi:hypothetical protein